MTWMKDVGAARFRFDENVHFEFTIKPHYKGLTQNGTLPSKWLLHNIEKSNIHFYPAIAVELSNRTGQMMSFDEFSVKAAVNVFQAALQISDLYLFQDGQVSIVTRDVYFRRSTSPKANNKRIQKQRVTQQRNQKLLIYR